MGRKKKSITPNKKENTNNTTITPTSKSKLAENNSDKSKSCQVSLCQILPYNYTNTNDTLYNYTPISNTTLKSNTKNYPVILKLSYESSIKHCIKEGDLLFMLRYNNNTVKDNATIVIGMVSILQEKDKQKNKKKNEFMYTCKNCTFTDRSIPLDPIYVLPKNMEDQFITNDKNQEIILETKENYELSSPSKSKFSFHAALHKKSSPIINQKEESDDVVLLASLSSKIGITLQKNLCTIAHKISIKQIQDNTTTTIGIDNCFKIIQHLLYASYVNTHIQKNQILHITLRGIPCYFQITSIDSLLLDSMNDPITSSDENATNDCCNDDTNALSCLENEMYRQVANWNDKILYQVTYDTIIEILPKIEDGITNPSPIQENHMKIGGMSLILKQLKHTLIPALYTPWLLSKNKSLPKGILLYGPSGTGKSMLSNTLIDILINEKQTNYNKLIIKSYNCTVLQSSSSNAESKLSNIFQKAYANCNYGISTLFIFDNIELLCPDRSSVNSNPNVYHITSTFLALVDGVTNTNINEEKYGTLMIVGITNNPKSLDMALRRPGRLDIEINVPIPDDYERRDILYHQLEYYAPYLSQNDEDTLLSLAKLAKGFTGADTLLAMKEAMRLALLQDDELQYHHIRTILSTFKPSTIRNTIHGSIEVPKVHWGDIGGMDEVKSSLQEVLELHNNENNVLSQYYKVLNITPPKGILLYGPPGCSKTLMARALATESNMNFLAIKGPELLSKWLGESERSLSTLFYKARQANPCIVFFDEIDAIASKRNLNGGGDQRLLSQLLTEMDGIVSSNVLVVAATNRPDLLDPALMRPGRMDRMIYVGLPDLESRESILKITLKDKSCHEDIDIPTLAQDEYTKGYTGAEIVAICREASLYAIEEYDDDDDIKLCMRHLLKAIQNVKRQITVDMLQFYDNFQKGKKGFS